MKGKDVSFKTFDEYRYHQYVTCNTPIQSLVPSSYCIRNGHIMLLFYLIRRLSSLLDTYFVSIDPRNYSWLEKNDFLLPDKCLCQTKTKSFENMQIMQRLLNKKIRVSKTSWKLHNILWFWCKMSKYLQHCVQMIDLLKEIVYCLPICHPLGYFEQISPYFVLK